MTIVALDANTGKELQRVPIAKAVPGALANYGYSETSAPICYNNTLIVGAAGSDYGVRGFVMAYNANDLTPAWPTPFWNIPPPGTEWRSAARIIGGCTTWTPTTVDPTTNTLYFGTAAASPAYYPSLRPGPDPRCTSLISVDLKTGKLNWWQQQLSANQWAYDSVLTSGWRDYGSVSAIDVATGKRVWKFNTPEPERGGPTTTAGGVGFVGGGDGNLRAFDVKTGEVLWKFQTGRQIASGPSVYSVDGKEYIAITVGDTVTSSGGGTVASHLQVFALGGSSTQSTGPVFAALQRADTSVAETVRARRQVTGAGRAGSARIAAPGPVLIEAWD